MKYLFLLLCSIACLSGLNAQVSAPAKPDSMARAKRDSARMAIFLSRATYPLIKKSKWAGVMPVSHISEVPDPSLTYKLLMEDVYPVKDSVDAKDINRGLSEVGRLINLHIASGIPKSKLKVVVIVHGPALFALYNNTLYRHKYGVDNPNLPLLDELMNNGVRFIACGQAMNLLEMKDTDLLPGVKISLTAQTVLSSYQLKGYVLYTLTDENN